MSRFPSSAVWLLLTLSLVLTSACGGKARAQPEPALPQPTPNRTVDAIVRGELTVAIPTATGHAHPTNTNSAARPPAGNGPNLLAPPPTATTVRYVEPTPAPRSLQATHTPVPTSTSATSQGLGQVNTPPTRPPTSTRPVAAQAATAISTPDGRARPVTPVTGSLQTGPKPQH